MILFLHRINPHYPADVDGYVKQLFDRCDAWVSQPLDDHSCVIVRAPTDGYLHPIFAIGRLYNLYIASYISEPDVYNPGKYLNGGMV